MMNKTIHIKIGIALLLSVLCTMDYSTRACTTGLAAARTTAGGRALLWKNRDSSTAANALFFFRYADTEIIGLINAGDTTQIWAGVNRSGFAIMNAEALDMAVPGETTGYDDEGYLMKEALRHCRSITDFEEMLIRTNHSGRRVTSNFGVIDSTGAAAFFETGNHEYFRFDANAPGYLVRANFTEMARSQEGYGRIRHARALELFRQAYESKSLNAEWILYKVAPDIHLPPTQPDSIIGHRSFRRHQDTINRFRTVATVVCEGIRPGEDPRLSTFWCYLGEPTLSVAVPVWVYAGEVPKMMAASGPGSLNACFGKLKAIVYSLPGQQRLAQIEQLTLIQKRLSAAQADIRKQTRRQLRKWRKRPPEPAEVARFQHQMTTRALEAANRILADHQP